MGPLEPPRVVTMTGVTYRPGRPVLPIPLAVFLPLLVVPFGPEPTFLGFALGLAVLPLFGWTSEATIKAHELVISRSWMGFTIHERAFPWHTLRGAEVGTGGRLELRSVRGTGWVSPVRGSPGQVAWIAGEINVRARRAAESATPGEEDAARQMSALRRAAMARQRGAAQPG